MPGRPSSFLVNGNGMVIPAIGLGTWNLRGNLAREMVRIALDAGYRHVDTAHAYENEREVGEALRASGLPREQLFVTTKVWWDRLGAGDLQRSAQQSLDRLQLAQVDLLLIHWPSPEVPLDESLAALAETKRKGWTRAIGVSNFPLAVLEQAVAHAREPLACHQVEYHPYLDQQGLLDACRRNRLVLTAYCPLARGRVAQDPVIQAIAARHARTPAQVALRWLIQQPGVAAIPRSSSAERVRENIGVLDFALDAEEMRIASRARPDGRIVDPAWAPSWD
jgi:2,5-diketo-D-gluconate reductase B